MKRILLVDNYDSFTYNLVHYLESLDCQVDVCLNDQIPWEKISTYQGIVLSPGPGLPETSGDLMKVITTNLGTIPILGVCLGMQALALVLGGELYNQEVVKHGVQESIQVQKGVLFKENDSSYLVGLYHSWAVSNGDFKVMAITESGIPMAVENEEKRCFGVQFHPESIMTPKGKELLENFLKVIGEEQLVSLV